jgi:hypothetical protein
MWGNISFNVLLLVSNSILVFGFGWGYISLPISWVVSTFLSVVIQIGMSLRYAPVQRTLQPLDWAAFGEVCYIT